MGGVCGVIGIGGDGGIGVGGESVEAFGADEINVVHFLLLVRGCVVMVSVGVKKTRGGDEAS